EPELEPELVAVAPLVERDAERDPPHPALERPLAPEAIALAQRTCECLLHDVVRALVAAGQGRETVAERAVPAAIEKLELFRRCAHVYLADARGVGILYRNAPTSDFSAPLRSA